MEIGEKIKFLRKNNDMSQDELASKLQINRNYLSRIETDKSEPTASIIKSISNLFDISVNTLLDTATSGPLYEDKIEYITDNCKLLLEPDLDFLIRIIAIMKEQYIKKDKKDH